MNVKKTLEYTNNYIKSNGYNFDNGTVESLYLSLRAKPFVILTGTPGCGKHTLAKLFCESIGANAENGRFKYIVPAAYSRGELFGYKNQNGVFKPSELVRFWKMALSDKNNPYFLYLKDINVKNPDDCLLKILTCLDTRYTDDKGNICSEPLLSSDCFENSEDENMYSKLTYPENLYIIASASSDESAYNLSLSIKDRANIIELSVNAALKYQDTDDIPCKPMCMSNEFMKPEYLLLSEIEDREYIDYNIYKLNAINKHMRYINKDFSFRCVNEIIFYLLLNREYNLIDENEAMDNAIIQRILPRIEGRNSYIRNLLTALYKVCVTDNDEDCGTNSLKMFRALQSQKCIYKKSAEKITYMMRGFEESGYCSFRNS